MRLDDVIIPEDVVGQAGAARSSSTSTTGSMADDLLKDASSAAYERDVVAFRDILKDLETPIDTVAESEQAAIEANLRAQGQTARLQSRYGIQLTPAERQQQAKLQQLSGQSNVAGAMNFARRRDEEANLQRLSTLANIYSSQRAGALGNLATLAGLNTARKNAYERARAGARSQQYGFLGNIGRSIGGFLGSLI